MLSQSQRTEISNILRPVSPPRQLDNVYTDDQRERLLNVVRENGPWKLIIAQEFSSFEDLMATMSGAAPEGVEASMDSYVTPTFRGYIANYSSVLYPEIHDCFYNEKFLDLAKSYWNAEYAKPQMMLFNINGPCANYDPGHLDSPSFRGVRYENSPNWLNSVMGKSGLFRPWLIKMAQVITWFSHDGSSGFTYWPEGPFSPPKRLQPPIYNRGVLVQNEMMMHRGEANGPLDQQRPAGLRFDTMFAGDSASRDHWVLKNGEDVIARHHTDELRFMVHWSAEVFEDYAELKKNMEGSDNLTHDRAIEMLIKDARSKGHAIETPTDPLNDPAFIRAINAVYDLGGPTSYPEEAAISAMHAAAA